MRYDKENFSSYYHEMSATLRKFRLPTWEEFPDIELYMDQMTLLINRYLAIGDGGEESFSPMEGGNGFTVGAFGKQRHLQLLHGITVIMTDECQFHRDSLISYRDCTAFRMLKWSIRRDREEP